MAERPDFSALAHAIALAAGRMAHGSYAVVDVTDKLAADLAAAWPPAPSDDITPQEIARHEWLAKIARQNEATDTPAQHVTWATNLIAQMSRQRLDNGQMYAVTEAIEHLRRASELLERDAAYLRDEAPPAEYIDLTGPMPDDDPDTHGSGCSSNPEIGCVCGLAERQSEEDEHRNAPDQRRTISVRGADVAVDDRVVVGGSVFAVTDIDTRDPHICLFSIAGSGVLLAAGRLQTLDIIPGSSR